MGKPSGRTRARQPQRPDQLRGSSANTGASAVRLDAGEDPVASIVGQDLEATYAALGAGPPGMADREADDIIDTFLFDISFDSMPPVAFAESKADASTQTVLAVGPLQQVVALEGRAALAALRIAWPSWPSDLAVLTRPESPPRAPDLKPPRRPEPPPRAPDLETPRQPESPPEAADLEPLRRPEPPPRAPDSEPPGRPESPTGATDL